MIIIIWGGTDLEAEGLVPALREDVEADLPADGVRQVQVRELRLQLGDQRPADAVRLVVRLEGVALRLADGDGDVQSIDRSIASVHRPP